MKKRVVNLNYKKVGMERRLRLVLFDTKKNIEYAEKRRKIGEEATKQFGVTCWG